MVARIPPWRHRSSGILSIYTKQDVINHYFTVIKIIIGKGAEKKRGEESESKGNKKQTSKQNGPRDDK